MTDMHSEQNTISAALRSWRAAQGLSYAAAAQRIGVAVSAVHSWEHGTLPRGLAIPAIAAALGIPVDELRALIDQERARRQQVVHEPHPSAPADAEALQPVAGA